MLAVRNRGDRMMSCDLSPLFLDLFVNCVTGLIWDAASATGTGKPQTFKTERVFKIASPF